MTTVVVAVMVIVAAAAATFPIFRWWMDRRHVRSARELPPILVPMRSSGGVSDPVPANIHRFAPRAPVAPVTPATPEHEVRVERVARADDAVRAMRLVKDDDLEDRLAPNETIRFRRPVEEPVQLLPGRLEVVSGDPNHREIRFVRIPGEPMQLILGREGGPSPQYVALKSGTVSRRHARLAFHNGRWAVENLSQTNPVVLNDEELSHAQGERSLDDGDQLELGEVVLRFHAR
jgi:hypothetical protein